MGRSDRPIAFPPDPDTPHALAGPTRFEMKTSLASPSVAVILALALAGPAHSDSHYGYDEHDHHGGHHHSSSTEKAVAGVVVGALAVAAVKAAKEHDKKHSPKGHPAHPHPQVPPMRPDYTGQDSTVIVRIRADDGRVVPVYLQRTPSGYVGPRGEYYASLPSEEVLMNLYGGWERPLPDRQPPLQVSVEQGRVRVLQGSRTLCVVRPSMPNVENFRLVNNNQQLAVKSRGNHGPAAVELFNVSDGSLSDKVLAFAIKNGKPAWARGMED